MDDLKKCKRCGESKTASEFVINRSASNGGNVCRQCRRTRDGERRSANREQFREAWRKWAAANPGKWRQHRKASDSKLRRQVIEAYGGECACCGEREPCFLTLDHINGGGTAHRKTIHGKVYAELRRRGFPSGYRILCWNCNWAHRLYGSCPHKTNGGRQLRVA